jgi:predicted small integral membrane protein
MQLRLSKIAVTSLSFFYLLVVVFNNLTDPNSNYQFVRHVLGMDTTFPGNALMYRSITTPIAHKAFYAMIIAWEGMSCALIGLGALKLWKARKASAADWKTAKGVATLGLTCGLVLWFFGFATVGGEWFLMWQSRIWNGKETAFFNFTYMCLSLIFLNQADD